MWLTKWTITGRIIWSNLKRSCWHGLAIVLLSGWNITLSNVIYMTWITNLQYSVLFLMWVQITDDGPQIEVAPFAIPSIVHEAIFFLKHNWRLQQLRMMTESLIIHNKNLNRFVLVSQFTTRKGETVTEMIIRVSHLISSLLLLISKWHLYIISNNTQSNHNLVSTSTDKTTTTNTTNDQISISWHDRKQNQIISKFK